MTIAIDRLFSDEEPLGPYVTPQKLHETSNQGTFISIYDDANFLSRENLKSNPNILLGRRGSGKTAMLYHLRFRGGYAFATKLDSESIFTDVASRMREIFDRSRSTDPLVETVAKFWQKVILSTVICTFFNKFSRESKFKRSEEMGRIRSFLEKSNLINRRSARVVLSTLVNLSGEMLDKDFDFIEDFLDNLFENEVGFNDAWDAFCDIMNEHGLRSIVLIDSLEQFPVARSDMRESLAGLLHFVGELDLEYSPVHITVCLPAELHEEFSQVSDNIEKDFRKVLSLHWSPSELFQMCGHRFSLYIRENRNGNTRAIELLGRNPSRDDVWEFWYQFFPRRMKNRFGSAEDSISYVSRHTQLLPRHFLNILNKIAMLSIAGRSEGWVISEDDIIKGVRLGESVICDGVINGFKQKYPLSRDVFKLIFPKMNNLFGYADLQRIHRDHGKGIIQNTGELLEMLVRMGVVGKLTEQTLEYDKCRFDYTYNGTMPYSVDDMFGVHPAFSGQFRGKIYPDPTTEPPRPIYPIESFSGDRIGTGALSV